jgi:hypothetical protein
MRSAEMTSVITTGIARPRSRCRLLPRRASASSGRFGAAPGSPMFRYHHKPSMYRSLIDPLERVISNKAPRENILTNPCLWNGRGTGHQEYRGEHDTEVIKPMAHHPQLHPVRHSILLYVRSPTADLSSEAMPPLVILTEDAISGLHPTDFSFYTISVHSPARKTLYALLHSASHIESVSSLDSVIQSVASWPLNDAQQAFLSNPPCGGRSSSLYSFQSVDYPDARR